VHPIEQTQLGQQVYERIAHSLLIGKLRPNDKLTIRALACALNVSSTPVRDAVKQLVHEQALEMRSPKDVRVPVLTERSYLEILDIRLLLEGLAAERAAERASPEQVQNLQELLDRNERAVASRQWGFAAAGNQEFHLALCDAGDMPHLKKTLKGFWLQMGPLVACYYDTAPTGLNERHGQLLKAMTDRDPVAARHAIQQDISSARCAMLDQISALHEQHFGVAAA
jgi:DNA-binding GntR family transcriptional regulator